MNLDLPPLQGEILEGWNVRASSYRSKFVGCLIRIFGTPGQTFSVLITNM